MKHLVGKKAKTTKVSFMGTETLEITKLTVAQVQEFQALLESVKDKEGDTNSGLTVQRMVIRMGVVGADELTDEELDAFPLDDLSKLVNSVLEISGVKAATPEGNASATNA